VTERDVLKHAMQADDLVNAGSCMKGAPISLSWQVGFSDSADGRPKRWVPAEVPGAVQLDWARANNWPCFIVGENWREYRWMEDVFWIYRASAEFEKPGHDRRLVFSSRGIDYRFVIRAFGSALLEQEGMFTPVELDVTGKLEPGAPLEIVVFPAPKSAPSPEDRSQANRSCKPAVSYGWDFHPRLIPLGIWDETGLAVVPSFRFIRAETAYELSEGLDSAEVELRCDLSCRGRGRIKWEILGPDTKPVVSMSEAFDSQTAVLRCRLDRPLLWWPNGQGEPCLYTSRAELEGEDGGVLDRRVMRIGFRRVRLAMYPGAWEYPAPNRFPKSRTPPPITLEINGRRIFAKGSNWVNPDVFPGRVRAQTHYRPLLDLAMRANMNLIRCWGGAPVQKDSFFDLCDEMGLMVWQEFPLACNRYEGTPSYLKVLDQESRSILIRLRHRACLVMWCGGNELFNAWSGMTEQDAALRLLARNCYDLDPGRPFIMTSPLEGMGHGPYVFRNAEGREVFRCFAESACTAYTEFGCGGPASVATLRRIIPPDQIFPPRRGTSWESHHAIGAWAPNSHLLLDVIEDYFGPCRTLEELVARGQLLQAEGLKCLFEEARRQKPRASMALNWCFNEPWPAAANLSIVGWPAEPKPAYAAVAGSLRPVMASARIARFAWKEGDVFSPELWLLNDSPDPVPAGRIEATVRFGSEEIFLLAWDHPAVQPDTNLMGPVARAVLPGRDADVFHLQLRCPGHPERDSEYVLKYSREKRGKESGQRPLNM